MPRRRSDSVLNPPAGSVSALSDFEGTPVVKSTIAIAKAGDGLSEALEINPQEMHVGDEGFFILRAGVRRVIHKPFDTLGNELVREHTMDTIEIVQVDKAEVDELLRDRLDKVRKAAEEKRGIQRLDDAAKAAEAESAAAEGAPASVTAIDAREKAGKSRRGGEGDEWE